MAAINSRKVQARGRSTEPQNENKFNGKLK